MPLSKKAGVKDKFLGDTCRAMESRCQSPGGTKYRLYLTILAELLVFCMTISLFWFSWSRLAQVPSGHDLVVWSNTYSPLLTRRKMHMRDMQLKSAFVNHHNTPPSIYRQKPSLDVDAAWKYITHNGRNFLITADEVTRLGKDPALAVRVPDELANGEEKYFAWVQGQHDLHCLDYVRQFMFQDYYFSENIDDPIVEAHFLHCLHGLVQSLQCKYSTDVYLAAWVEGQDFPVVDFNISRKCLDYENDYRSWEPNSERTHANFFELRAPPDAIRVSQTAF